MLAWMIQISVLLFFFVGIRRNHIFFFYRDNTASLKFICSLIVVFVHIGTSNAFILGYFHFVAVTVFFVLSGYGLTCSYFLDRKVFLRKHPWRIIKLSLPLMIVSLIRYLYSFSYNFDGIKCMQVFILFYVVYGLLILFFKNYKVCILLMSIFIVLYSLLQQGILYIKPFNYIFQRFFGWGFASIGFVIGMYICIYTNEIVRIMRNRKYVVITSICFITLLIISVLKYIKPHDITMITTEQFFLRQIISLAFVGLIMVFFNYYIVGNRFCIFIGSKLSIYIFSFHGIWVSIVKELNIGDDNVIIFTVMIGTFVSALVYHMIGQVVNKFIGISTNYDRIHNN